MQVPIDHFYNLAPRKSSEALLPSPLESVSLPFFQLLVLLVALIWTPNVMAETAQEHSGAIIGEIRIHINDIFEQPGDRGFFKAVNRIKANTREYVVRQELLFKEGQAFDSFLIEESERALRQLGFLRRVSIVPAATGSSVDVDVYVQDTWTLFPVFVYSTGGGNERRAVGFIENNLFGHGKRLEGLWADDEGRETIEGVWEDRRLFGTRQNLILGHFSRTDGFRSVFSYGRPFRSLVERGSWKVEGDISDLVGRLFESSDESFLFRNSSKELGFGYTWARGDAREIISRYTVGYAYSEDDFSEADDQDFEDVDVDPLTVDRNPDRLASDREFSGPFISISSIVPDFESTTHIDKFERIEDFNLGFQWSGRLHFAPKAFASAEDSLGLSVRIADGARVSDSAFMRGELVYSSRFDDDGVENSISQLGIRYYNVLGASGLGPSWGIHTLAGALRVLHADRLYRDSQFVLGASNGLRGYKNRTFTGDTSLVLNLEHRVAFAENILQLFNLGGAIFFDAGGVTERGFDDLFKNEFYSNFGIGIRIGLPRSSSGSVLRIDLAFPLRDGPDGSGELEPRLLITTGQVFRAFLTNESTNVIQTDSVLGAG